MKTMAFVAVLVAAAAPLAAQQPAPHDMGHGMPMHGPMMPGMDMDSMMAPLMRAMAYAPQHLLWAKDSLHLTGGQVARLTALGDSAMAVHNAAALQARMHLGEMEEVMRGAAADTSAVKAHFDAARRYMGDAMWAMVRAATQARALLTDAQRRQVDAMARRPMPMHGGGMGPGAAGH